MAWTPCRVSQITDFPSISVEQPELWMGKPYTDSKRGLRRIECVIPNPRTFCSGARRLARSDSETTVQFVGQNRPKSILVSDRE